MVVSLACRRSEAVAQAAVPSISIRSTVFSPWPTGCVLGEEPGCVYPSIVTAAVRLGSADASAMVCTPEPTMLNAIVSGPAFALASRIAWRSVPVPESAVDVPCTCSRTRAPGREQNPAARVVGASG